MTTPSTTAHWHPSLFLRILLFWTALTTLVFWLPTVRGAFDGGSYAWSALGFGGSGTSGDYWFPVLGSLLSIMMLWLGWRGAPFAFHLLLGVWHTFLAVGITMIVLQDPEGFHLQGDTVGMDIDLAVIGPVFFGAWALVAWWWILRDRRSKRSGQASPWTRRNTYWLVGLIALLLVQFRLLHDGSVESDRDLVGVLITVAQWMLLGVALAPRHAMPIQRNVLNGDPVPK